MKVLYVLSYLSKNGGVQSVVNNYIEHLNEEIKVDFLALLPGDSNYEEEIRSKGHNIYMIKGSKEKNLFLFMKEIKNFFKDHHNYDIIHSHQTNLDIFYLREAKKWHIPVRIMHTHSTNCDISKLRMFILKKMSKIYANYYFACSHEAGRWMFGKKIEKSKKFYVVNNGIDAEKYQYNEEIRNKIRKQYNLEDNFVIGNVARMVEMKNHLFLVDVFKEILKLKPKSKLLLVGDGVQKQVIQKKVEELELIQNVIFYGVADKVYEVLQAMDVFVLPSLYEGVPVTVIEAAASGIKYVISSSINSHLKTNDLELKLDLNLTAEEWAKQIVNFSQNYIRKSQKSLIENSGFDINKQVNILEEIYNNILKTNKQK